ncbi:MAG: glycosyltransferase [Candidatus Fermentibacteraceae bacterium]|nr:glycosyltransferase [Candidatus Fermentibacteraceae bacterium]MBN2608674.1 glycosyltransferase [Candidatus Fermentibacteraceae bacterium]
MNAPFPISVIVPAWNDFQDLEKCLMALSRQTARDRMEVVVSLDGGDPLPARLEPLTDKVVSGDHAGPAAARNRGFRNSAGDYVLFTDSDCVPAADWAEEMTAVLESGADAVKGVYTGGGRKLIQRLAQIEFLERYSLLKRNPDVDMVDTYSAGYRREALEASGGFDESFPFPDHEDVDLSYRMASMGFIMRFAPRAGVSHSHRDSWIAYFRMKYGRGRWRTKVLRRYPRKTGSDSYTPACMMLQIALCALLPAMILLLAVSPVPFASWSALFLLSTIPLAAKTLRHDPVLLPLVPLFSFWRGCALSSGLLRGIFGPDKEAE